jgi:uncharacterized protein (DUF362 family)
MKIHPFLQDPNAVFVFQTPLSGAVTWETYRGAAVEALGWMQVRLEGEKAVLKPNATSGERFANPDTGITTHPAFIQGMLEYLRDHGARAGGLRIVEDPRNSDDNHPRHWRDTGFDQAAQSTGAKLHSPSTYTSVRKTVPSPLAHADLNVSRLAVDPDTVLFNVPKLKTHNLAITTLCLKNLMGLVVARERHYCIQAWGELPAEVRSNPRPRYEWLDPAMHRRWQEGLARRLADTAQVIHPALNVVEGIVGREGTGFQRGRNRPLGLVAAGINMVAVDSLVSYLTGFDPTALVYLDVAARAGLGENRVEKLSVFTAVDGELRRCADVRSLRIQPPFRVISGILGEDLNPFQFEAGAVPTGSDPILNPNKI